MISYLDLIKVFYLGVAYCCFDVLKPLWPVISISAVVDSNLVHWEDYLEWEYESIMLYLLLFLTLNEDSYQAMHILMSLIILLFIAYLNKQ